MDEYKRIACNFYDELEAASVKKVLSTIVFHNEKDEKETIVDFVIDFKIFDKAEYMVLKDGKKIRLDKIIEFNEKNPKNYTH